MGAFSHSTNYTLFILGTRLKNTHRSIHNQASKKTRNGQFNTVPHVLVEQGVIF